jgi:hypothetical protein
LANFASTTSVEAASGVVRVGGWRLRVVVVVVLSGGARYLFAKASHQGRQLVVVVVSLFEQLGDRLEARAQVVEGWLHRHFSRVD